MKNTRTAMKRRTFLQTVAATGAGLATPALGAARHQLDAQIKPAEVLPAAFQPRIVRIRNEFEPYTIHVDPAQFALYWVLEGQKAVRYAVGIGRPGLYEGGEFTVGAKKVWPSWTPTREMIQREPELYQQHEDGMPGGLTNPLGARALYLFQPGRGDTFLRIHGTHLPNTIGRRVSNGCARLVNAHIVEFYERVPLGTKVILYPATA
jgi:lipoprotein-anchoring transpeptidase ErfK/SrfK